MLLVKTSQMCLSTCLSVGHKVKVKIPHYTELTFILLKKRKRKEKKHKLYNINIHKVLFLMPLVHLYQQKLLRIVNIWA